ncbi:MAG: DUF1365 domain-containing protein [Pseudomonadota bacterium]
MTTDLLERPTTSAPKTSGGDPIALYSGEVMHQRLKPFGHRFQYSVFNILIDIDSLDDADLASWAFTVNRAGLISFYEKDHGAGEEHGLADHIRGLLKDAGIEQMPDLIRLLCYPRVLGYVFNPISIYFCEYKGDLTAMVYEVRNTFGGKHIYVEPLREGQHSAAGIRQECDKHFYVSPFIDMPMRYFFRLTLPEDRLQFRILEKDAEGPLLAATLSAKKVRFSTRALFYQSIRVPFLTVKVMAAIHYEALKLWVKGARFYSRHKAKHETA